MIERDIILTHESGRELRGAVDGAAKIVAPVYTHFDSDGRPVSLAFVISVLSGFVRREALVNGMVVHSEMPSEKSSPIVTAPEPLAHGERVMQCVGAARRIVSRMNSDKCRTHRPMQRTSAFPWGDDVLRDFEFGWTRGSHRDASGTHCTGRKEKPRQDNGKKPKCAKFYRYHSWSGERKAIKGCRRELCRIIRDLGSGIQQERWEPFFELARVVVRLDHAARFIVNANRRVM